MKFLLDMNMSPSWAQGLISAGFEAVHWSSVGATDAEDTEIAAYAATHGYIIVTSDLDFGKILSDGRQLVPSVIQLRLGDLRQTTLLETLLRTVTRTGYDLKVGALVTIGRTKVRVARLPIGDNDA